MTESEPREPWADTVGFTEKEWADFARLRRGYRERRTACPWCQGTGQFGSIDVQYRCPACETSGNVDEWTALHAPDEVDEEPALYSSYSDLPAQLAELRDRLENISVPCPDCDGTGRVGHNYACRTCDWAGSLSAFRAATHVTIRCPRCGGGGIGGSPGVGWACSYCSRTGRIGIDRLQALAGLIVGDNWGFFLNIQDLVLDGLAHDYGTGKWWKEFNARQEAMPGVRWSGVDFSGEDLSGLDLSGADLAGCTFEDVASTRFVGANLSGARILGDARGADFTSADLSQTLLGADLNGSTIHLAADVTGADFTEASGLTETQRRDLTSRGAIVDDPGG